ncbi:MAG: hypothetical protein E3J73_08410 [Candidatus Bathyarchaeum sp.]|nr:MAG: hypothetical protein E3J73_08410 [Candidatus Bathyarchaeum sp.]
MTSERVLQSSIIKELERQYPEAVVLKIDSPYIQGFPDLLFLQNNFWAALEVKRARNAVRQPNQKYWVDKLDLLSFSRFIYPSNLGKVFDELEEALGWSIVRR